MKTDNLISALSADTTTVSSPITSTLWLAAAAGAVGAALVFFALLGFRRDLAAARGSPRFFFKLCYGADWRRASMPV